MQIIEPNEWPAIRDALPPVSFLMDPLIPAGSTTFVHGPPGCGKSAFAWGVANAITVGEDYLGLKTSKAACLLISTDMNLFQFKLRWGQDQNEAFKPLFPFVVIPKCDVTSQKFAQTKLFSQIRSYVSEKSIRVVLFDALGGLHAGKSARDDETATLVDAALNAWLPGVAKVLLGHDRKRSTDNNSQWGEPDGESFMGSQIWLANATSQVRVWRAGKHKSILRHGKSQVSDLLSHDIQLYIDMDGKAELWQEKRAQEVIEKTNVVLRGLKGLTETEKVACLMRVHHISERTAWRWLSLAKG